MNEISKAYGDEKIDVIQQNPELYSFNIATKTSQQCKKTFSISQYIKYQQESLENPAKDSIYFGVNIDIGHWKNQIQELQKLPNQLFCTSKYDALSYLNPPIAGVNAPQMYLKIKGCWTGGHEENLRVQSLNINHGK